MIMDWGSNASEGTKSGCKEPIELNGEYIIHWKEYSSPSDVPGGTFYVAINRIE